MKVWRILLILCITGGGIFWGGRYYLESRLPVIQGEIKAPGISSRTRIVRDRWGVPHINAENEEDAYFSLGFAAAQDRLFQMDLQRRLARGELSEILGPTFLDVDRKFRTLLLKRTAQKYLDHADRINPDALEALDAFLAGVNHFIDRGRLPVEFTLLGTAPRHFTRLDSLALTGYMAYSFARGIRRDSLYTILASRLTPGDMDLLFPPYSRHNQVSVMEPDGTNRSPEPGSTAVAGSGQAYGIADFLASFEAVSDRAAGIFPPFEGSNSWVLAPFRTQSGHAVLANDPHIGISNPGVWYEAQVEFPGMNLYGYHLPLLPFPLLGHDSTKAWGLTMFQNDDLDLYREAFDPENPGRVRYRGGWAEVETLKETIRVKDGKDVSLTIRITPHGPVISDFLEGYQGPPVSLCWVFHRVENPLLDVVYGIGRAGSVDEFRQAVSGLAAPGLNFSYIDREGNIAWWAAGRIPVRPPHTSGKEILDGASGRDEWGGYLPFGRNPQLINPPGGMIVTANNLSTFAPIEPVGQVPGYFSPSDRAARIVELLGTRKTWDMEGLKTIQNDVRLFSGPDMAQAIVGALRAKTKGLSRTEIGALESLASWDGRLATDSAGATVFEFTVYHIVRQALDPVIGPELATAYLDRLDYWSFLKTVLSSDRMVTGKAVGRPERSAAEVVRLGFGTAVAELVEQFGDAPREWHWGQAHTVTFEHPLGKKRPLDLFYNIGPFPGPGGFTAINKMQSKLSRHDFRVSSLPSTRRLIDCNDPDNTWAILPTGNSGNFKSRFYRDQADMYMAGRYRKILYLEDQYLDPSARVLTLIP